MTSRKPKSYKQRGGGLREHVVVWEREHGPVPPGMVVDHIDGDIHNNSLENLRACSRAENAMNSRRPANNKTGLKGLSWDEARGTWRGSIKARGCLHQKRGALLDVCAWLFSARKELHGQFARH